MSIIDRAIASVAPVWGLKRAMARRGLGIVGGGTSQRYVNKPADWGRNTGNPDDARPTRLVDRIRILDLVARDPFAKKALNSLVNNAIGWGITGAPKNAPKSFAALWAAWTKACDYNGRLDFYGLQELAVRSMFRDGEVFIVLRTVRRDPVNPTVPLKLQLLDSGMLSTTVSVFGGNQVVNGIEYDAEGRAVAYHFQVGRSGQAWASLQTVRIEAKDVIHLFVQEIVGQRHGVSVFEPVVKRLGDIDEAVEAEIIRKNIEACFVGLITQGVDEDGRPFGTLSTDSGSAVAGLPTETLTPGMLARLAPGENVKFGEPKASGGLNDIVKLALLSAAAGTGITYEQISGDLSNVNYSSYRAGSLEFQRSIGRIQFNTIIPTCLERISARFQADAFLAGMMPSRAYEMNWTPPPFESVDPVKEATGNILLMQAGLESRRNIVNSRGYDFDKLMTDIAADDKAYPDLLFKGDPSSPAQSASADDANAARALAMHILRSMSDGAVAT